MKSSIREFLREDIGSGDITSSLVIPPDSMAKGQIVCKEPCVLAGVEEACAVFEELGANVTYAKRDGAPAKRGEVVLKVEGHARALLAGERLALNLIMRLSGIATLTRELTRKARKVNRKVKVAATRKTTPGFREFEKRAVALGGGEPHRFGLFDAILIKNNHIRLAGGIRQALSAAKLGGGGKRVEIEVESPEQAFEALENGADIIMLDNFRPADAKKLYARLKKKKPSVIVEVSGGITPENIAQYAKGADIISLGRLTHSVKAMDFSMRMERA
jgi:nicotinate-nucleotide pyrophosphorylase (carboxylating)